MKQIIIDISPAGSIKIDAKNFTGGACAKATEQLEIVLGGGVAKKTKKPEFFAPAGSSNNNKLTF